MPRNVKNSKILSNIVNYFCAMYKTMDKIRRICDSCF